MGAAVMAKQTGKKSGGDAPDGKGRKTAPVQVDKDLARMAATIAAHDGRTIADILSPLIKQWIMTNYERVQKEMQDRLKTMRDEHRS